MATMPSRPTTIQALREKPAACAFASVGTNAAVNGTPNATPNVMALELSRNARRDTLRQVMFMVRPPAFRRDFDRSDDAVVGAAAAQVARHVGDDLLPRRLLVLRQQRCRLHDLARLAVAALHGLLRDPGLLQGMVAAETLDGGDFLALRRGYRRAARAHRVAIQMHGAGAALRHAAAEFGAGKSELVAQHPK